MSDKHKEKHTRLQHTLSKKEHEETHAHIPTFVRLGAASLMGIAFGIAMEKARVFEPFAIREQMVFSKFIMLKMFLSAVVTGQLAFAIMSRVAPRYFATARHVYSDCVYRRSYLDSAIGGALLGAGMTVSGACPGMVIIQTGSFVQNSLFTLAGLFTGVYLYASVHKKIEKFFHKGPDAERYGSFLDENSTMKTSTMLIGLAAMMAGMIAGVEYFFPWTSEVATANVAGSSFMEMYAWPPVVAGIVVGLLQIPAVIFLGDTLGSSTSYATVCSHTVSADSLEILDDYLGAYRQGVSNWWQVIYIGSALGGAFLSSSMGTGASTVDIPGIPAVPAFIGGILMMFGSRMAGGCTSGHGLSGMGLLAINSFIAVPAMFAGGMAVAFVLNSMGALF